MNPNFTFDGWYIDAKKISSIPTFQFKMPYRNTVLMAKTIYVPPTEEPTIAPTIAPTSTPTTAPSVKLALNKGTGISAVYGAGTYNPNDQVVVRAAVMAGYRFLGWFAGSVQVSSSAQFTFTMPNADITLRAMAVL
jgi:uncharacterized repeat protein (TIGR02543 family)